MNPPPPVICLLYSQRWYLTLGSPGSGVQIPVFKQLYVLQKIRQSSVRCLDSGERSRRSHFCSTMKQLTAPMGLLIACNMGLLWRLHSTGWLVRRNFDAFGVFSHILIRSVAHFNQLLHFYFLLIESHKGTFFFSHRLGQLLDKCILVLLEQVLSTRLYESWIICSRPDK